MYNLYKIGIDVVIRDIHVTLKDLGKKSKNAQPVCITSVWNIHCQRKVWRLMQVEDRRSGCVFLMSVAVRDCENSFPFPVSSECEASCALLYLFPPLRLDISNKIGAENLELYHLSRHKVFVWGYYLHTHQGGCNISASGYLASGEYSRDFTTNKSSKYKETM